MAADISDELRQIQQASRGEQVRDAICTALIAINDDESSATEQFVNNLINNNYRKK